MCAVTCPSTPAIPSCPPTHDRVRVAADHPWRYDSRHAAVRAVRTQALADLFGHARPGRADDVHRLGRPRPRRAPGAAGAPAGRQPRHVHAAAALARPATRSARSPPARTRSWSRWSATRRWWSPVSNPLAEGLTNAAGVLRPPRGRPAGAGPGWQPRDLPKDDQAALWKNASLIARLRLRRFPAALLVQAPGFGEVTDGRRRRRRSGWSAHPASWPISCPGGNGPPGSRSTGRPRWPIGCGAPR